MQRILRPVICALLVFNCAASAYALDGKTQKNEYWDNGKIRISEKYDNAGTLREEDYYREDGTLEQFMKYDALGHKIGEAYYAENGRLRETADGWAAMRWKYDGDNMVAEGYYGPDGKLKELKQYNDQGDLIAKRYVGVKPDPDEEYAPVPPLAGESNYYYDKYGRLEGSTSIEYDDDIFPILWDLEDRD